MKNAKELALLAARALSDKKGKEIQVLEIGELTTLADYFVIATGLLQHPDQRTGGQRGEGPAGGGGGGSPAPGGYRGGTWVLLDYGCIAVHVFNAEAREFYGLERLWRDGTPVDLTGVVDAKE